MLYYFRLDHTRLVYDYSGEHIVGIKLPRGNLMKNYYCYMQIVDIMLLVGK